MNRSLVELRKKTQHCEGIWPLMRSMRSWPRLNIDHRYKPLHKILQRNNRVHRHHSLISNGTKITPPYFTSRKLSTSSDLDVNRRPSSQSASNTNTTNIQPATRQSNYGYRDLLKWTENILHPIRTPIGSIHPSLWKDIFVAMQVWLGYQPSSSMTVQQLLEMIQNAPDPSRAVLLATTEPLIPRHVDLVDRLLSRLWYEQSAYQYNNTVRTHRRKLFQQHHEQLQLWTTIVCQSWFTISHNYSNAPLAIQKATTWYNKMNDTIWSTITQPNDATILLQQEQQKALFIIALIQAHQRLVETPGMQVIRIQACQSAANMLLDISMVKTMIPHVTNTPFADILKACYQLALQQTLELVAEENATIDSNQNDMNNNKSAVVTEANNVDLVSTASLLLEQIIELSELPGWSDIQFQDGELDKVFDALFLDRMKGNDVGGQSEKRVKSKKLSTFERGQLQQRILTKINQAMTINDQDTVEEMVLYWRSHMQSSDDEEEGKDTLLLLWKPFAQAVTNYYLRIQDHVKATKWMQIQEQMPSQEAVLQAIQNTTTRPSLIMTDGNDDDKISDDDTSTTSSGSKFEELIALNRVFAENEEERIKQKLNLLDIWVSKVRSPSVPWRATEILESIESEMNSSKMLTPTTYAKVVKVWLNRSFDSVAGQKALEIAMRCPVFDMSLLISITNLIVKRQTMGDKIAPQTVLAIIDLLREKFDDIPADQMELVVMNALQLLRTMPQSLDFLKLILNKGVTITSEIMNEAVRSYPPNVALLLPLYVDDKESGLQPSLTFRKAAFQHLLTKTQITPEGANRIATISCDLTSAMCDANEDINDILDLNYNTLRPLATVQCESFAKRVLFHLEKILYTKSDPSLSVLYGDTTIAKNAFAAYNQEKIESPEDDAEHDEPAVDATVEEENLPQKPLKKDRVPATAYPIPMSFYEKVIVLFAGKKNIKMITDVYQRLQEHRGHGYVDLNPGQNCCGIFLRVAREVEGMNSLDSRIDKLLRLIGRYTNTNQEDENFKPQYIWFDVLIGDLHERMKVIKATTEVTATKTNKADPHEKNSRAAVKLLHKMHLLRIVPDNLERVYPWNAAMEMVIATKNQRMHYKVVTNLKTWMDDLSLVSNAYTMSLILKSCEGAESSQNFAALTTMVQCLTDLRQMGKVHPAVYNQCFKIFQLKRVLNDREFVIAEKMMSTVFKCCLDDGMLINPVRYHFKALTLPMTYKRNYFDLLEEGCEPTNWTRNADMR